jgi:hypothetical protein
MIPLKFSVALSSTAALFLTLSLALGPLGCSSSTPSHGDAGGSGGVTGQSDAGTGGSSSGATGGRGGSSGAGGMTGADAGIDVRSDANGAGGRIVLVDASGNTYTCADLLACCNTVTDTVLRAQCASVASAGNASMCNNTLTQIKANGACL